MFNVSEGSNYSSASVPLSEPLSQSHRSRDFHSIGAPNRLKVWEVPKGNS